MCNWLLIVLPTQMFTFFFWDKKNYYIPKRINLFRNKYFKGRLKSCDVCTLIFTISEWIKELRRFTESTSDTPMSTDSWRKSINTFEREINRNRVHFSMYLKVMRRILFKLCSIKTMISIFLLRPLFFIKFPRSNNRSVWCYQNKLFLIGKVDNKCQLKVWK